MNIFYTQQNYSVAVRLAGLKDPRRYCSVYEEMGYLSILVGSCYTILTEDLKVHGVFHHTKNADVGTM